MAKPISYFTTHFCPRHRCPDSSYTQQISASTSNIYISHTKRSMHPLNSPTHLCLPRRINLPAHTSPSVKSPLFKISFVANILQAFIRDPVSILITASPSSSSLSSSSAMTTRTHGFKLHLSATWAAEREGGLALLSCQCRQVITVTALGRSTARQGGGWGGRHLLWNQCRRWQWRTPRGTCPGRTEPEGRSCPLRCRQPGLSAERRGGGTHHELTLAQGPVAFI